MEKKRILVTSNHEPENTNVIWHDSNDNTFKEYSNGNWNSLIKSNQSEPIIVGPTDLKDDAIQTMTRNALADLSESGLSLNEEDYLPTGEEEDEMKKFTYEHFVIPLNKIYEAYLNNNFVPIIIPDVVRGSVAPFAVSSITYPISIVTYDHMSLMESGDYIDFLYKTYFVNSKGNKVNKYCQTFFYISNGGSPYPMCLEFGADDAEADNIKYKVRLFIYF